MKRQMADDVARLEKWSPSALEMYRHMLETEIRTKQHLKAAAMKAQRNQRKARASHEHR